MAGTECRIGVSFALAIVQIADEMGGRSNPDLFRCLACGENGVALGAPAPRLTSVRAAGNLLTTPRLWH